MEEKIREIFKQLYKDKMSLEEAEQQVLDLFDVMPSLPIERFDAEAGQEAIELLKELRGFAPYCTDHRQRVDDILLKVSVDMEVSQNEA